MKNKTNYAIEYIAKNLKKVRQAILREDIFGQQHLTVWYTDSTYQTFHIHSANKDYANTILAYSHNKNGD